MNRRAALLALALGLAPAAALAAGSVEFVRGVVTAERAGAAPRVLGRGDTVDAADVLETASASYALVRLDDGTRLTMRPLSRLEMQAHDVPPPERDNVLLGLLKGGLRVVSGLLAKRDADAFRIRTVAATIGIRGTQFDARLCADDCAAEAGASRRAAGERGRVVGRAVSVSGEASIGAEGADLRRLAVGGGLLPGDVVVTGADGVVVLAFSDGAAVTLQPYSRFRVERYEAEEGAENVLLRLFRGGLRMVTGLIGQRRAEAVSVATSVATIGIRGTGFDVRCEGACATGDDRPYVPPAEQLGLHVYVWQGAVTVTSVGGGCGAVGVGAGQAAAQGSAEECARLLDTVPRFLRDAPWPRPDAVPVDLGRLFGALAFDDTPPGLYVTVQDGHVVVEDDEGRVDLAASETGYAPIGAGGPVRVAGTPGFLRDDRTPRPDDLGPRVQRVIELFDEGGTTDIGGIGRFECTID